MEAFYSFVHGMNLHLWDIPALAVLLVMIVVFALHKNNQKRREKKFEDQLAEKMEEVIEIRKSTTQA